MNTKLNKIYFIFMLLLLPALMNAKGELNKKYIIVVALEAEVKNSNIDNFAPIIYTGVGKVNAAIKLYEAILKYKPQLVINYGTAGSVKGKNGLFHIDTFVQRDMDVRPLGVLRGVTPFSNEELPKQNGIVLGTGDSFVTDFKKQLEGLTIVLDLVDMEGYALQKVSIHHNVKFQSYKYVSDSANANAKDDWEKNVAKGTMLFEEILTQEYGVSTLKKK